MSDPVFYVATALGERTAGPEALTQLVDAIRRRGIEAYLIPMRNFRGRRNDPEYDIYDFGVRERIADPGNSIFVSPEVSPLESMREFRAMDPRRTWMGWFSVNNSVDPRARTYRPSETCCPTFPPGFVPAEPPVPADLNLGISAAGPFATLRESANRTGGFWTHLSATTIEAASITYAQRIAASGIGFFAQSYYAQGFVREVLGAQAPIITDPIRIVDVRPQERQRDLILYNKVKSWSLIGEVSSRMPDVEFRAIEGMSFAQVAEALASATVYLELGHLPGRDRMPREAAHFGTPVICLARGAGYCWQDVPLPVDYRIAYREGWPDRAVTALRQVLADPDRAARDQEGYRDWVAGEKDRYEQAVDAWLDMALART